MRDIYMVMIFRSSQHLSTVGVIGSFLMSQRCLMSRQGFDVRICHEPLFADSARATYRLERLADR